MGRLRLLTLGEGFGELLIAHRLARAADSGLTRTFGFGPKSNECASVELTGDGFTLAADQRSSVIASASDSTVFFKPYRMIASFPGAASPY